MMKITIRHPAGFEIGFEGDADEFERFTAFLSKDAPLLRSLEDDAGPRIPAPATQRGDAGGEAPGAIVPKDLGEQLARIGAATDVERVTVMAQAAVDAGYGGIEYAEVDRLFQDLGQRKPSNLRQTFANAKRAGYVRSLGQGRWKPTVAGENLARLGVRPKGRTRRANQLAQPGGERGD